MATVAEPLVGRAAELGLLDRAVAELDRREGGALVVAGEPGIGKTRLLAELAARADARGHIVLAGGASELEADLPFWVFADALEEYVAGVEPRRLASLGDDVRAELAHVFPALGAAAAAASPDERYRTHRAVRELLERLAASKPLVLVLDDVHWADAASVELLGALLRRPPDAAVLLALAARPRQIPDRLAVALERARRDGTLARLELGALPRADARQLLGDAIGETLADALYAESGGNPFYLEQLARVSAARPPGGETVLAGVEVPSAVAAALAEELALLSPATRRVFEGAAVAGDPFEPELAAAAAAVDEGAVMQALDELLALELVRRTDVPRRLRFRHPLVRRAVYEAAPGGWVLGAHERCAEALARAGASATGRAHHVEHAARHGDPAALAVLCDAGELARPRAPASAARWFGAALRVLPQTAPAQQRVGLLTARAGALAATGELAASRADLLAGIGLLGGEDAASRIRLIGACAAVEHLLGRHDEARARLAGALHGLGDPAAPEAAALMSELAIDGLFAGDYAAMREWAGRARDGARAAGDPSLTAGALLALAEALAGAVADAEAHRTEMAAVVDATAGEDLACPVEAVAHLATTELYLDRYADAGAHAERALAAARATGQRFPTLVPTLGTARFMQGRLAEAAEILDGGVEAARLSGVDQAIAWSQVNRSLAASAAGDVDTALAAAEEGFGLTRPAQERFISAWAGVALAAALLPARDPAGAADVLRRAAGGEEVPFLPAGWRAMALELLTRCWLALGRREEAGRAAARAEAQAAALGLPMAAAWASRAAAEVALDAAEPIVAAGRALASAAAAEQAGAVVEAALSRTLAGRALAQAGDVDRAAAELERAAAALAECGALRHRDAAERELRKLGRHPYRRTRRGSHDAAGLASLTGRELQVARLVVDRKTNPEIAAELFLSIKTIETHLRNIFAKLGVSSRVELARAVERAGGEQVA